jgi:hypothetical protein
MTKYFPYVLTPELEARYKACLDEMQAIQNIFLEGTSQNDMAFGTAMGNGNYFNYCQKACAMAVKYPEYVSTKAHFTVEDFVANNNFATLWNDTATQRTTIESQKKLIEGLSGRGMSDKAKHVHDKMGTDKNIPSVKADYDDLHSFFTKRAEKVKSTVQSNALVNEAKTIIEADAKKKEG